MPLSVTSGHGQHGHGQTLLRTFRIISMLRPCHWSKTNWMQCLEKFPPFSVLPDTVTPGALVTERQKAVFSL